MRYQFTDQPPKLIVQIESRFTLIDFTVLLVCFILGFIFALFFWIFFVAVFLKLFVSFEFEFDSEEEKVLHFIKLFSYIKFKRREFQFDELTEIRLSNEDSGPALQHKLVNKDWYSLTILLSNSYIRMAKVQMDEFEELYHLYTQLHQHLGHHLLFKLQISHISSLEDHV